MNKILSYSTLGFGDRDIEAALDAIAAAGFRGVELVGHTPHLDAPPTGEAVGEFRRRLEQRGFVGWTIHSPFWRHTLGAPDEDWRHKVMARAASYIDFAGAIGASGLIVHPVPNPELVPDSDAPGMSARIGAAVERSLDDLTPLLERAGVRLLLENLPYHCAFPYMDMTELRPLVERYPAKAVGLVVDTGHAGTQRQDPASEIRRAGARLWGTHLHDVDIQAPDDQHWPPGPDGLDWDAVRAALLEIDYAGMWTFEVAYARRGESREELIRATHAWATRWINTA